MRRMKRLPKVTWQLQAFVSVFLWESLLPGSLQLPLIISATSHQADSAPSEDEGVFGDTGMAQVLQLNGAASPLLCQHAAYGAAIQHRSPGTTEFH